MSDTSLTAAKLMLTGAYTRAEAETLAARLDADPSAAPAVTTADQARPAMLAAAEAQRERDALAAANQTSPEAQASGYTEAQLRSMSTADFAAMDEAQFAEVQRALKTLGPAAR